METKSNPNLYIFIPCHNRSELTLAAVNHIASQLDATAYKYQIHVLDDGSTDGSASKLSKTNPLIRIHRLSGKHFWGGSLNYIIDYCKNVIFPYEHKAAILIANDDICLQESSPLASGIKLLENDLNTIIAPVVVDLEPGETLEAALAKDKRKRNPANVNYGHYFDCLNNSFLPLESPNKSNLGVTVATWFPIHCFKELPLLPNGTPHYGSDYWLTMKLSEIGYTIKTDLQYIICRSKKSTKASQGQSKRRFAYWSSCCDPRSPDYLDSSIQFLREFSRSKNKRTTITILTIKKLVFKLMFGHRFKKTALLQ